jgi:hypothetical protein
MRARVWIATLTGATLAATVGLVGSGTLSTANASGPTWLDAGTLTLSTTASTATGDGWSYSDGTTTTPTQFLTTPTGSCVLTPTSGPLVNLSATNGVPGFASHSIGVTQGPTSSQCNKVNINKTTTKTSTGTYVTTTSVEALTVALNNLPASGGTPAGSLYDPTFGGLMATATHLDLDLRDGSKVTAQLFDHTTALPSATGAFTLIADEDAPPATLPLNTVYCRTTSGEDDYDYSGTGDNCGWNIAPGVNFDSILLTPVTGAFSLQGGGEFGSAASSNRTTFTLVKKYDGTFATCDGKSSATTLGSGNVQGATLTRLANNDPSQPCAPLPYTFSTTDGNTTFHKPQPTGDTSQFAIALTRYWPKAPNPVPAAQVNWEDISNSNLNIPWCVAGAITSVDANNLPTSIASPLPPGATDQSPDASGGKPGLQYACIYKQSPVLNLTDGSLTQVDYIYFTGDIKFPTA